MTQQTWSFDARRRPVVLAGGSQLVQDQVARACAAAGVTPVLVGGLADALPLDPTVLLVGADQALGGLPHHRDVIVVGTADDETRAWARAANLASSRVVILPQGGGWLAEHLGRRVNPAAAGSLVGFLGAVGGCGVSTFAFWCARSLARRGRTTLLVDGHATGGGLDLALGLEERPGVRWQDLGDIRGTLNSEQLASALPSDHNLSVLSHTSGVADIGPSDGLDTAGVVLDAARGAFDLTLVDCAVSSAAGAVLASMCDELVLLVPSRPKGVAAAHGISRNHSSLPLTVVLRGPVFDGLDAWHVAELMEQPGPLPYLPSVRGVSSAEASGRMLDVRLPRKARKTVDSISRGLERPE